MKVLVLGSGAREHALVRSLLADPSVREVVAAPGNAGIAADVPTVALDPVDADAVVALARAQGVDLVVVGPEAPLVAGVADAVRAAGIACFGPGAEAARLEGSKAFAKDVMASAGVPTAMAHVCVTEAEVRAALDRFGAPYVVKDDGLAAGKGVLVTLDRAAAERHALACLAKPDGAVLIEEYLDGPEVSLFCVCDGEHVIPLPAAQDFKRIGDGDAGPNTGGMGAYAPLAWAPAGLADEVVARVAEPVVAEMARRGTPFTGLLYVGLALTSRGMRVVEFNVRFGDPETEAVLALLDSGLGALLMAAARHRLADLPEPSWRAGSAVTVVVAAPGYPDAPRVGDPVGGLEAADAVPGVKVLHAGTALGTDGVVRSAGGRVLAVTAYADDLTEARARAYRAVEAVDLPDGQFRSDIARDAELGQVRVP
jgi:phosphoribosylamine--glycine ligase